MPTFVRRSFVPIFALLTPILIASHSARADAISDLEAVSQFKGVDLNKLAEGKPIAAPGGLMPGFTGGMAVQTCYVIHLPLKKAFELHKNWSPMRHPDLKVYVHGDLPSKPTKTDFQGLASAPDNAAVKWLVDATERLDPQKPELQMSSSEAKQVSKEGGSTKGAMPPAIMSFWANLLSQRASAFASGGVAKLPPYNLPDETVVVSKEIGHLLSEQPKVRDHFKALLDETGLASAGGKQSPSLYYELFNVDGHGAFTLGASYSKQSTDSAQIIDAQIYATEGYYALITFYQLWPVKIGSEQETLVWRTDLLSSASLARLHGVERSGSVPAMKKEIEKTITYVQKDAESVH